MPTTEYTDANGVKWTAYVINTFTDEKGDEFQTLSYNGKTVIVKHDK